jgi:hypothetical protein
MTRDVMSMMDEGKSLKEMQAHIEQKYSKYGSPTPTPPVPRILESCPLLQCFRQGAMFLS